MSRALLKQRCEKMVVWLVGWQNANDWWYTPHMAFDRRTPKEQWLIDPETVYRFLIRQTS
jgi:hypothetical protein